MRLIESKDNALFKRVQRLAHDKRELDGGDQLIWLEGIHLCQMWMERRGLPELAVFEMDRHSDELLELARFLPGHLSVTFNATLMNAGGIHAGNAAAYAATGVNALVTSILHYANPAANASLSDSAYVANRFRVV
ncbi:RNA methyltransferase, partial [Alcaligenes faecalis subsp. faecalis NCIB 8687]